MAVVIETTVGDFTVDLFVDSRPQACKNFLKLCKMKYYNFCLFHSVQPNFLAQTGDPTGTGSGGESIYGLLYGENARYFEAETIPKLKHNKPGLLSMVSCGNRMLGSQFFITLGEDLVSLDGEHCVFGEISEGVEIVLKLNEAICDNLHRPYKDIRITHTIILEDPFDDPSGLIVPDMSPEPTQERLANGRIGADEEIDETAGMTAEQVEELKQEREAKARATILEIVGDLPDAEMAPPENVLFICKLNPVTTDDDLEIIFSRFGKVKSCEVIRDKNTGDSLQYAFVEFEDQKACEEAYFKMDNVLIDDRRIHVDFSQSVAKMRWKGKGRGVEYFDNKDQSKESRSSTHRDKEDPRPRGERSVRRERDREYEERERRRERGRDREEDRNREKGRDRENDDRYRRRDDRDRSRSDWRKRDKRDYREDDKRYDKRRELESSRKREDDLKKVSSSSSRKGDERKIEEKRPEEKKADERKESRSMNGRSGSRQSELEKCENVEKSAMKIEKLEIKDKDRGRSSKYNSPIHVVTKDETLSDSFNDSREVPTPGEDSEKSLSLPVPNDVPEVECKINHVSRRSSKDDKRLEDMNNDRFSEGRSSQKSDKKLEELKISQEKDKKKSQKRKRKVSESRKRKKRRHSSSSESSSESSDSSDSSSSSDSSDYKHSKKKKLIVAKRYYRGGKLVKEIKKKKRTKDTSDSESGSQESSDSDSKRKYKSKKHKKVINIYKQGKKKSVQSSEDSQSESSTSEDSDDKSKRRKKKTSDKRSKKKSKHSSKKKKKRNSESSSSSDSENSVQSKSLTKKHKKLKNSKLSTNLVTTTSE